MLRIFGSAIYMCFLGEAILKDKFEKMDHKVNDFKEMMEIQKGGITILKQTIDLQNQDINNIKTEIKEQRQQILKQKTKIHVLERGLDKEIWQYLNQDTDRHKL